MTQRLLIAIVTGLLLHFSSITAAAQGPQFSIPTYNQVAVGSVLSVPVIVHNFDSIVSIGMVLQWDPSVIKYLGTSDYSLPDFKADNIGDVNAVGDGDLRVVWWKFSFSGYDLNDGDTLFIVRFRAIGAINSGTAIAFGELNPELLYEVQEANGATYSLSNSTLTNGFVAIGYTVGTAEQHILSRESVAVSPNPVQIGRDFHVQFDNKTAAKSARFSLLNAEGKLLSQKEWPVVSGKNDYVFPVGGQQAATFAWLLIEIGGQKVIKQIQLLP